MQDIYDNNLDTPVDQSAGTPGAGQFAPKAGVGSDDDLDSTEASHRLASITDRAGDERMERRRAARHPLLMRLKGLFRGKPSPTPPLPPKGRGHALVSPRMVPDAMRDEARAAFVESHPGLDIRCLSYDRGDGRYDQDFHADEFDRIVSSDPRLASDYSNMLRDRFGLGVRR